MSKMRQPTIALEMSTMARLAELTATIANQIP